MNEEEKRHLADEVIGTDEHGMELRFQDQDLWILPAEMRLELEGEEAVKVWQRALAKLTDLTDCLNLIEDEVVMMVLQDAVYRAEEARRRVQERAEDAM